MPPKAKNDSETILFLQTCLEDAEIHPTWTSVVDALGQTPQTVTLLTNCLVGAGKKSFNWKEIAAKLGSNKDAMRMRYSRLKMIGKDGNVERDNSEKSDDKDGEEEGPVKTPTKAAAAGVKRGRAKSIVQGPAKGKKQKVMPEEKEEEEKEADSEKKSAGSEKKGVNSEKKGADEEHDADENSKGGAMDEEEVMDDDEETEEDVA